MPFEDKILNFIEIFNECGIALTTYFMILFTDYADNTDYGSDSFSKLKEQYGMWFIGFFIFCLGMNVLYMVVARLYNIVMLIV